MKRTGNGYFAGVGTVNIGKLQQKMEQARREARAKRLHEAAVMKKNDTQCDGSTKVK